MENKKIVVYCKGNFIGENKEMLEMYEYSKDIIIENKLEANYIDVTAKNGWYSTKILKLTKSEPKLINEIKNTDNILGVGIYSVEITRTKNFNYNTSIFLNFNTGLFLLKSKEGCIDQVHLEAVFENFKKYMKNYKAEIFEYGGDILASSYVSGMGDSSDFEYFNLIKKDQL